MNRVQQYFLRGIGAGVLSTAMLVPAAAVAAPTCVSLQSIKAKQGKDAAYVAQLFNRAGVSTDQPKIGANDFSVCTNPNLLYGAALVGSYSFDNDVMQIDVSVNSNEIARVRAVAHEMRHRTQHYLGIDYTAAMNVPESERVMMALLAEADAWLEEVLLADRARSRGDTSYVDMFNQGKNGQRFMKVFDHQMHKTGGNKEAAMRAFIYEFISHPDSRNPYIDYYMKSVAGEQRARFAFNPSRPRETMMEDATFKKFGDRGKMGQYMDDKLMQTIRHSFTQEEYERRAAIFRPQTRGVVTFNVKP